MLLGWQRGRMNSARAANEMELNRIQEAQRQLALRVADQTAQGHSRADASDDSDSDSGEFGPIELSTETPGHRSW